PSLFLLDFSGAAHKLHFRDPRQRRSTRLSRDGNPLLSLQCSETIDKGATVPRNRVDSPSGPEPPGSESVLTSQPATAESSGPESSAASGSGSLTSQPQGAGSGLDTSPKARIARFKAVLDSIEG